MLLTDPVRRISVKHRSTRNYGGSGINQAVSIRKNEMLEGSPSSQSCHWSPFTLLVSLNLFIMQSLCFFQAQFPEGILGSHYRSIFIVFRHSYAITLCSCAHLNSYQLCTSILLSSTLSPTLNIAVLQIKASVTDVRQYLCFSLAFQ